MTNGQRILAIMEEERHRSLYQVTQDVPEEWHHESLLLYKRIQDAFNTTVQEKDGALPTGLCPALLRIIADEMDRVGGRLADEGLLYPD